MSGYWILISIGAAIGSFIGFLILAHWLIRQRELHIARRNKVIAQGKQNLILARESYRSALELALPEPLTRTLQQQYQACYSELGELDWQLAESLTLPVVTVISLESAPLNQLPVYLRNLKVISSQLWREAKMKRVTVEDYREYQSQLRSASAQVRLECYFRQCLHAESKGHYDYAQAQAEKAIELAVRDNLTVDSLRFERFLPIEDDTDEVETQADTGAGVFDEEELGKLVEALKEPEVPNDLLEAK